MFDVLTAAGVLAGLGAFLALLLVLAEKTLKSGGPTRLTVNDDQPKLVDGGRRDRCGSSAAAQRGSRCRRRSSGWPPSRSPPRRSG